MPIKVISRNLNSSRHYWYPLCDRCKNLGRPYMFDEKDYHPSEKITWWAPVGWSYVSGVAIFCPDCHLDSIHCASKNGKEYEIGEGCPPNISAKLVW